MREITLTRDKSVFDVRSATADGQKPKRVVFRSSRLVTTQVVKGGKGEEDTAHLVVLRGNTMIGVLRMFHILLKLNNMQGKFWNPQALDDADQAWQEYLRDHLPEDVPPDWVNVYLDGKPVISTWPQDAVDAMEKRKIPRPIEQKDMVKIGTAFFNSGGVSSKEVSVKHISNPAVIVQNTGGEVKVKILSRQTGRMEPLFMRVEQEKSGQKLMDCVELAADIVELSNRITEFHVLKQKLMEAQDLDYLRQREIKPASRDLLEKLLAGFHTHSEKLKVEYQPAEPNFVIPA